MIRLLQQTRRHDITFHPSGRIDITARVAHAIGLQAGDVVNIATDNREYYLFVSRRAGDTVGRHEARCMPTKHGSHYRCYSKRLADRIRLITHATGTAYIFAGEPATIDARPAITLIIRPPD